jgi:hypothetical protein
MYKTLVFSQFLYESCRSVENAQTLLTCHIFLFSGFNWYLDFFLYHTVKYSSEQFSLPQTSLNIFTNNSIRNLTDVLIPICGYNYAVNFFDTFCEFYFPLGSQSVPHQHRLYGGLGSLQRVSRFRFGALRRSLRQVGLCVLSSYGVQSTPVLSQML